jgi:hypothetical protein
LTLDTSLSRDNGEVKMKKLLFAALAALSLGVAVAPAYASSANTSSADDLHRATRMQQTGAYGK